jgi:hypothetical protein
MPASSPDRRPTSAGRLAGAVLLAAAACQGRAELGPTIPLEPSPLTQHAAVEGRVLDERGRPIAGTVLTVLPGRPPAVPVPGSGVTLTSYAGAGATTAADGGFRALAQRSAPARLAVPDTVSALVRVGPSADTATVILRFGPLDRAAPVARGDVVVQRPAP